MNVTKTHKPSPLRGLFLCVSFVHFVHRILRRPDVTKITVFGPIRNRPSLHHPSHHRRPSLRN